MEYLSEAKKFIQHARESYTPEARNQHLDMAEWCISRATYQPLSSVARGSSSSFSGWCLC
jgi:hypothetical protein